MGSAEVVVKGWNVVRGLVLTGEKAVPALLVDRVPAAAEEDVLVVAVAEEVVFAAAGAAGAAGAD